MASPFASILTVAEIMQEFPAPWFVSGGWAIDLFLETVTRSHFDIEIGIYRRDQQAIRKLLPEWNLEKSISTAAGGKWVAWEKGEELQLPVHQIKADSQHGPCKEFEFFLNECTETHWTSRRHDGLTRKLDEVVMNSSLGIPILLPEIQLLFKAKQTRPKDQADFERALPRLSSSQIEWLTAALSRYHSWHPWIQALAQNGS